MPHEHELLLRIRSEPYEEECTVCNGAGVLDDEDDPREAYDCNFCESKGKRLVRVETKKDKQIPLMEHDDESHETWGIYGFDETFDPLSEHSRKWMVDLLMKRYHSNTLPDEIRNRLKVVPVEDSDVNGNQK
jgi:hypothetical protein